MGNLPKEWTSVWEREKSMALFMVEEMKDGWLFKVYVVNMETLKVYHVVDFPGTCPEYGCIQEKIGYVFENGKLYVVGDRHLNDVHVCDLSSTPPYVWTPGPPMRSSKLTPHLVAYNSLIFVLSMPDDTYSAATSTFEIWDTTSSRDSWEVLPDPSLRDYNLGLYQVISHSILDGLIYFVFDYTRRPDFIVYDKDSLYGRMRPRFVASRVVAFDPMRMVWIHPDTPDVDEDDYSDQEEHTDDDEADTQDLLSLYLNFSAYRHQGGVNVMEFFEGDPTLRMFLIDPRGDKPSPPCFYTYDLSTFNTKTLDKALRENWSSFALDSRDYFDWFQAFVRSYLSSVTGLATLMEVFRSKPHVHRAFNSFVLPCSYDHDQGCWTFCVVLFDQINITYTSIAKFRLRKRINNNSFHAEAFEVKFQYLPNMSRLKCLFSKIP